MLNVSVMDQGGFPYQEAENHCESVEGKAQSLKAKKKMKLFVFVVVIVFFHT
jgi:hypothetical protein